MENENIELCYDCDCEINTDTDNYYDTAEGHTICEDCRDNNYTSCYRCGDLYENDSDDLYWIQDIQEYVCSDCFDNYYYTCNSCGYHFSGDSINCTDNGDFCDNCYEEENEEENEEDNYSSEYVIHGYHTRDIPIEPLYTQEDLENDLLYAKRDTEHIVENMIKFGMEIEVENAANKISNNKMAKMIREKFPHLKLVFEEDGSLYNGFEIITEPMSMAYIREHENDFREICKMLEENGFRSHNGGNCGQHIHFSRVYFSDNDDKYVGKLLNFFERYKREIYKFSRREGTRWCSWISDNTSYNSEVYKSSKILCDYAKEHTGHGVAVNLQHTETIEIRVFRGTLKFETLMSNFEFVNALVHLIKEQPTRKINFDKVINYEGNKYIQQYCQEKEIFNSEYLTDETSNIFRNLQAKKDKYEQAKEEVKSHIEIALNEMLDLSKKIMQEDIRYTETTANNVKKISSTIATIQNLIAEGVSTIQCDTLKANNEKVEDNYRYYIGQGQFNVSTIVNYYKNIERYLPENDYTQELRDKMKNIIEDLENKYVNVGVEI